MIQKTALALIAAVTLAGCKVAVIVVEGGEVQSTGSGTCQPTAAGLTGNVCIYEVTDTNYSETFTAVPAPGWTFLRWQSGTDFICGDSTDPACLVSNVGTAGNTAAEDIVASNKAYYVMPVFERLPDTSDCGQTPAGVTLAAELDWAEPDSQLWINVGKTSTTAMPLTATTGNAYEGQLSITASTGTSSVQRQAWFSQCPGGTPLDRGNCDAEGTSSTTLRWKQVEPGIPWESNRCNLRTGTSYFLNVRNVNCPSNGGCAVFLNNYTNGMPF